MSLIGRKILSLSNQKESKRRTGNSLSFTEAQSIGVLFTWEDRKKEATITEFVNEIGKNKRVQCLCFNPNKKEAIETTYPVFDLGQLSLLGKIESPETNEFIKTPFDYLFHFDFELSDITQSLLSRCNAQYRVGFHTDEGENFYELMIGINKSAGLHNFAGQMLKYVNALK